MYTLPWNRKANPAFSLFSAFNKNMPAWTTFNMRAAADRYAKIDIVYACIDMIARNAGQVEFSLFSAGAGGEEKEIFDHDLLTLLNNPNSEQSRSDFIYSAVAYQLMAGNTYINANVGLANDDDFTAKPVELWNFRSDRMKVIIGDKGVSGYQYKANGTRTWTADKISGKSNILHWKTFNPTDDFSGLAPMQAARRNIEIYEATLDWNKGFLDNGACPSSVIFWKGEGKPSENVINELKKQVNQKYSGSKNARKNMVLPGNFEWKDMSLSPKDMDFLKAKETTIKDIARVFKVNPILVNIGGDATFSNMGEAKLDLWDSAVIPQAKSLVENLNRFLVPRYDRNLRIKLNLSNITALEPRRQAMWERANTADYLTINEKRSMVGKGDTPDGDVIFVPATSIPLSFAADPLAGFDTTGEKKKNLI